MKKILMLAMVLGLLVSICFAGEPAPDGFKKAKFGMTISQARDEGILAEKDGTKFDGCIMFRGKGEMIGEVGVLVNYWFYDKSCKRNEGTYMDCQDKVRLGHITASIFGHRDVGIIKSGLVNKYGNPTKSEKLFNRMGHNIGMEYVWVFGLTGIKLTINELKPSCTLRYEYYPLMKVLLDQEKEGGSKAEKDL